MVIGLQWEEFRKSGQPLDSYAGKSLIANTTTMTFFTATSLVTAGTQIATLVAGGAEAVAGTALGMAAGVLAGAALPLALLMIAVNGAVGCLLWAAEYGDYIRPSTDLGDVIGASVAKFFGIQTDVMQRAEVEKNAVTAAANQGRLLDQARQDDMAFRGEQLAESGYGSTRYPRRSHEIAHATFRMPKQDPDYTFVLQEQPAPDGLPSSHKDFGVFDRTDPPAPPGRPAPDGVAWIDLKHDGRLGRSATADPKQPQLFELQGAAGRYQGGEGRDVFVLDADATPDIDGRGGPDEVDLDATGQQVTLRHDAAHDRFSLTMDDAETPAGDPRPLYLSHIESVTIRNAIVAEVTGGPGDDRLDVSALQTAIAGGGGRNTYVLREGNRIASSSDDAAVWSGSVNAFIDFIGDSPGKLLRPAGPGPAVHRGRGGHPSGADRSATPGRVGAGVRHAGQAPVPRCVHARVASRLDRRPRSHAASPRRRRRRLPPASAHGHADGHHAGPSARPAAVPPGRARPRAGRDWRWVRRG